MEFRNLVVRTAAAFGLALGMATTAHAAAIVSETYAGVPGQFVTEGSSYHFTFDLWYKNPDLNLDPTFTDSNLSLVQDAQAGEGTQFDKLWLSVLLYDMDRTYELTGVGVAVLDPFGLQTTASKTYTFTWNNLAVGSVQLPSSLVFSASQSGLLDVTIAASNTRAFNNDFYIAGVGIAGQVAAVPEPATLGLLGLGLLVVAAARRRRQVGIRG